MANVNAPFGLRPIRNRGTTSYTARMTAYLVPATDNTALYIGDLVKHTNTGATTQYRQTLPIVTRAGVGETAVGVVAGFFVDSSYLNQVYRTASTERIVFVFDDPNSEFEIQTNGTAVTTDFGKNADIAVGTPSTVFGTSGMVLDQTTITAGSAQLQILQLIAAPDNEIGQYARMIVRIREHYYI